jgi:hypothetical protein
MPYISSRSTHAAELDEPGVEIVESYVLLVGDLFSNAKN